ncbi:hypothetical protein P8452_37608 [Trifolium repens]|nr:hypothetical protein P8452_37608 [Trifolium repens]
MSVAFLILFFLAFWRSKPLCASIFNCSVFHLIARDSRSCSTSSFAFVELLVYGLMTSKKEKIQKKIKNKGMETCSKRRHGHRCHVR